MKVVNSQQGLAQLQKNFIRLLNSQPDKKIKLLEYVLCLNQQYISFPVSLQLYFVLTLYVDVHAHHITFNRVSFSSTLFSLYSFVRVYKDSKIGALPVSSSGKLLQEVIANTPNITMVGVKPSNIYVTLGTSDKG